MSDFSVCGSVPYADHVDFLYFFFSSSVVFFTIFYQNYLQEHLIQQATGGKCILSEFTGMLCFHQLCHVSLLCDLSLI